MIEIRHFKEENVTKVIQNNYKKEENKKVEKNTIVTHCDQCDSELEVTKEDTHIGWLGARFITCPCCGEESMVEELQGITLTKDNIKFPVHFYRTKTDKIGVKEVADQEVVDEIKRGIEYLRINKNEYYWFTSHGDLFLIIFKYDGDEEYNVLVTRDWYETNIPFEEDDYKWDSKRLSENDEDLGWRGDDDL